MHKNDQSGNPSDASTQQKSVALFPGILINIPWLRAVLERLDYRIVIIATDPDFKKNPPDNVILDDSLKGDEIVQYFDILKYQINLPVLYIHRPLASEDCSNRLLLESDDYLLKPFTPEELEIRIRLTILRHTRIQRAKSIFPLVDQRKKIKTPKAIDTEPYFRIDHQARLVYFHGKPIHFTPKEYKLFGLLASKTGHIFSNQEIIEHLWGENSKATDKDVQQYIYGLRKKIEKDTSHPSFLHNVPGFGYKLERIE